MAAEPHTNLMGAPDASPAHDELFGRPPDIDALTAQVQTELAAYAAAGLRMFATSSFQTNSVVLLDLLDRFAPTVPVVFLNTGYHFPETLAFRRALGERFSLKIIDLFRRSNGVSSATPMAGCCLRPIPTIAVISTRCCRLIPSSLRMTCGSAASVAAKAMCATPWAKRRSDGVACVDTIPCMPGTVAPFGPTSTPETCPGTRSKTKAISAWGVAPARGGCWMTRALRGSITGAVVGLANIKPNAACTWTRPQAHTVEREDLDHRRRWLRGHDLVPCAGCAR